MRKKLIWLAVIAMVSRTMAAVAGTEKTLVIPNSRNDVCDASSFATALTTLRGTCGDLQKQRVADVYKILKITDQTQRETILRDYLDNHYVDLNIKHQGFFLLCTAVELNHPHDVRLLLENGANAYWEGQAPDNKALYTPIAKAIVAGYVDIVKLFFQYGFSAEHHFKKGINVLSLVGLAIIPNRGQPINPKHLEILDFLITKGVDISSGKGRGLPLLEGALRNGHTAFANQLLARNATVTDEAIQAARQNKLPILLKLQEQQKKQQAAKGSYFGYGFAAATAVVGFVFSRCTRKPLPKPATEKPIAKVISRRYAK